MITIAFSEGDNSFYLMCVPSMGIWYQMPNYSRGCKSLTGELVKPVSKPHFVRMNKVVVWSDPSSEGSGTTKSGTDEQEWHTEAS